MQKVKAFLRDHPLVTVACVLFFICFLFISHPFGLYFLCDDWAHVPESMVGNMFQTHLLRPLIYVSLWLDAKMWAMNATGFHLTNVFIHIVCSTIVFVFSKAFIERYAFSIPNRHVVVLFAAIFFLCYAFHSEPLFWIVGRGGSLSTMFLLLSLLFYFRNGLGSFLLSILWFVCALSTYELSWALPMLISLFALYDRILLKKRFQLNSLGWYWLVFIVYFLFRFIFLSYPAGYGTPKELLPNLLSYSRNFTALVARLFVPPMKSSYGFVALFLTTSAMLLFLLFLLWKRRRDQVYPMLLLSACGIVSILPVVSLGIDTHDTESERFIYLASVFACIFLIFLLATLIRERSKLYILYALLISLHLFGLYRASKSYRYASSISRLLAESLNSFPAEEKITLINLPTQYKGALLFRTGFVNNRPGILNKKYDSIKVISNSELTEAVPFSPVYQFAKPPLDSVTVEFKHGEIFFY